MQFFVGAEKALEQRYAQTRSHGLRQRDGRRRRGGFAPGVIYAGASLQRVGRVAWHTWAFYARASFRNWNTPQTRYTLVGMRLVLEPEGATPLPPADNRSSLR